MQSNFGGLLSRTIRKRLITCVIVAAGAPAIAQVGGGFDLPWSTVDGGGVMWSVGGTYSLGGTIGQPDAASLPMTGGGFSISGGFWQNPGLTCSSFAPADYDLDCDVDSDDFTAFAACFSGPTVGSPSGCAGKDFDHDGDVDQNDFGVFQRCYSGAGRPADPSCGMLNPTG